MRAEESLLRHAYVCDSAYIHIRLAERLRRHYHLNQFISSHHCPGPSTRHRSEKDDDDDDFMQPPTRHPRWKTVEEKCPSHGSTYEDKLVSREMLKYLYDRLDPDTMVLVLGKDRVIHINPFAVKQVFGIPDIGEELSLHTNQEACKALSAFKDFIGLQEDEDVHTKYLQEIWEADIELDSRMLDDDMCIKIFFMIASNKLLFPSSDNNIRAKDVYLARNLSRLPTMNWCKAVTDEIRDAVRTWRLDRTTKVSPSITGCAIFLLIVYLDNLRNNHQINHKDIPRANLIRDINDTVYYMPHHSIPEKPANIQPVTTIQFPSILSELGGVVNVTVAKPKRKLLVQALAEFDIKSKKATTFLNRGQLMLQASHDQLVAKVRSILENQSCENNSIGYVTNQHIHQEAHVPLQQNSPTKAAAPQPTDATANAESEQELDHEHSPVHTDVTIGDVVPPILDQATNKPRRHWTSITDWHCLLQFYLFGDEHVFYDTIAPLMMSPSYLLLFIQNHNALQDAHPIHMPDGGGYRVSLSHRIGEYVNMEDEEEFEQWEFQTALEILESDIAAVDTTNVKLFSLLISFCELAFFLPIMEEDHYICLSHQPYT
ncbi:unnamed protein product [Miscanthus lutarioriparius]|uniref:Uncharacterized protein n=1 Tax=Miscanthus lutarioriparius TaxID=422564 RepID=A0A811P8I8_9POAL|nr:unnamed protein product [Miscanthus lutarioriparius]